LVVALAFGGVFLVQVVIAVLLVEVAFVALAVENSQTSFKLIEVLCR
jgi:hypothetical protein